MFSNQLVPLSSLNSLTVVAGSPEGCGQLGHSVLGPCFLIPEVVKIRLD